MRSRDPGSDPRSPFVAPKASDGETPVTPPAPAESNATSKDVTPPSPLPREVTLPLRVLVEENQSKTVSAGIGYTTNSGPRATLGYNIINFLGGAKQLRTNLSFDRLNQTIGSDLIFPTTAEGNRYSISSALTRTDVQNEITRSGTLSGKRAWGPETTERSSSPSTTSHEQKDISGIPQSLAETLGVTNGVTLRRTDNLLSPTTGYLVTAQVGAGIRVNTGQPYSRAYGKGIRYLPINENNTLLVRLEIGGILGRDTTTLPSSLLFAPAVTGRFAAMAT